MKTTTFAILAVAATAVLFSPSARADEANDYYLDCLDAADAQGTSFINGMILCTELTDEHYPDQASESVKPQRLKLKRSRIKRVIKARPRVRRLKKKRY